MNLKKPFKSKQDFRKPWKSLIVSSRHAKFFLDKNYSGDKSLQSLKVEVIV